MKRIDFENGTVTGNILGAALPMLVAQILNLLYNICDPYLYRTYSTCGNGGTWSSWNLFSAGCDYYSICEFIGGGGAPLFSIEMR